MKRFLALAAALAALALFLVPAGAQEDGNSPFPEDQAEEINQRAHEWFQRVTTEPELLAEPEWQFPTEPLSAERLTGPPTWSVRAFTIPDGCTGSFPNPLDPTIFRSALGAASYDTGAFIQRAYGNKLVANGHDWAPVWVDPTTHNSAASLGYNFTYPFASLTLEPPLNTWDPDDSYNFMGSVATAPALPPGAPAGGTWPSVNPAIADHGSLGWQTRYDGSLDTYDRVVGVDTFVIHVCNLVLQVDQDWDWYQGGNQPPNHQGVYGYLGTGPILGGNVPGSLTQLVFEFVYT